MKRSLLYSWFARDFTAFPVLRICHVGVQQHAEFTYADYARTSASVVFVMDPGEKASENASEKTSEKEGNFPVISDYCKSLEEHVRRRYLQKISAIGVDPAVICAGANLDTECLPPIESMDIFSYLVLETSFYTKEQFKNFKSLEAHKWLTSGFVISVQGCVIAEKFVVLGKVKHSQRMNDPAISTWIIASKEGTVLSAHCMDCKAGLGECCSHVASILFYIEAWASIHEK